MGQSQQTSPSWHSYPSGSHSRPPRQPGDRARHNGIVRMLPLCLRNPGRVDTRPKFRHTCKQVKASSTSVDEPEENLLGLGWWLFSR